MRAWLLGEESPGKWKFRSMYKFCSLDFIADQIITFLCTCKAKIVPLEGECLNLLLQDNDQIVGVGIRLLFEHYAFKQCSETPQYIYIYIYMLFKLIRFTYWFKNYARKVWPYVHH